MIAVVGEVALCSAAVASAAALVTALGAEPHRRSATVARFLMLGVAGALVAALSALAFALVTGDMTIEYVAAHTSRDLPTHLRLAALWAGQEGSLLLWACLAALAACVPAARTDAVAIRPTLGVLAALNFALVSLVFFTADPFTLGARVPPDGFGLHPQLQHWAMVVHPPLIFGAFASLGVVFALVFAATVDAPRNTSWVRHVRTWTITAWMLLGAGMTVGGYWAYVELGWGGYWAWDPVENASLMPWLVCTALLHVLSTQRQHPRPTRWTSSLAFASFALCALGSYLTRSGSVQSVHAFGSSRAGPAIAWLFLGVLALSAFALYRQREHRPDSPAPAPDRFVRAGSAILVVMAAITLMGTLAPLITSQLTDSTRGMSTTFYARSVAPLALALAACMAMATVLHAPPRDQRTGFVAVTAATVIAMLVAAASGARHPALLAAAGAAGAIASSIACAALAATPLTLRRAAAGVAHAGFALLLLAVTASSVLTTKATATLAPGDELRLGPVTLLYEEARDISGPGYAGIVAHVRARTTAGDAVVLTPEKRTYARADASVSEVGLHHSWSRDIYVALVGWNDTTGEIAVEAHVTPLVSWVWVSAGVILLGGLLALAPRSLLLIPAGTRLPATPGTSIAPPSLATTRSSPWND